MNIVYVHGFRSAFDGESTKMQQLSQLGNVYGPDIDYDIFTAEQVVGQVVDFAIWWQADMIVGTSLGGWVAAEAAHQLGIMFVACNPAIKPYESLLVYDDLHDRIIATYGPMNLNGFGLILLDKGDDVLDYSETLEYVHGTNANLPALLFDGGSHRFEHMDEALDYIDFIATVQEFSNGA